MKTETETSKILLEIKLLSLIKLENNCLWYKLENKNYLKGYKIVYLKRKVTRLQKESLSEGEGGRLLQSLS